MWSAVSALTLAAVTAASPSPQLRIPVTMVSSVSSATAKLGDTFTFKTTETVQDGALAIPAGTQGRGIVTAVSPAAGTHRGTLELLPQYLQLSNGARIAVVPASSKDASYAAPRHVFPFPLPFPGVFIIGGIVNPGGNVTIGPGTDFTIATHP